MPNKEITRKVLLIDDDIEESIIFEHIIGPLSYELFYASSVKEYLEKMKDCKPDIIILDYNIPGEDLVKNIKKLSNKHPVVVYTGSDDRKSVLKSMKAGADDFLVKNDVTTEGLDRTIDSAVKNFGFKNELRKVNTQISKLDKKIDNGFGDISNAMNAIVDKVEDLHKTIDKDQNYFFEFHNVYLTQLTDMGQDIKKLQNKQQLKETEDGI